eukprot:363218-Chlamydomonas_euryale.AAC.7
MNHTGPATSTPDLLNPRKMLNGEGMRDTATRTRKSNAQNWAGAARATRDKLRQSRGGVFVPAVPHPTSATGNVVSKPGSIALNSVIVLSRSNTTCLPSVH